MNQYEEKLKKYIADKDINAQLLNFIQSCHTAQEAAQAINADIDELVKSICLVDSQGQVIIAIVKGADKVSMQKIKQLLHTGKPRPATEEEILHKTGYPVGGVPPFGYVATFLIDSKVMEKEIIYSGGGSKHALTKVSPVDMQKVNQGKVVDIRK